MKKTNVMIETSDDVYERVISPAKKKKSFGKLVALLLDAYANNESIYSYINGEIDNLESEATEGLLKDLNSMAESLSMLGALSSEAEATVDNGKKAFTEFGEKASNDISKVNDVGSVGNGLSREDVVEIVEDSMSEIKDMLKKLLESGVSPVVAESSSVAEPIAKEVTATVEDNHVEKATEITEEEQKEAEDALSSLMGSIGW